jgi:hypothetical protein
MSDSVNANVNEMDAMSGRAERLIAALTGALMSTAEAAAERLELAAAVAAARQRLAAFACVLESVQAQKDALQNRLATAPPALRALYARQIEMLTLQEMAVLEKAGVPQESARQALALADATPLYERRGSRFLKVGEANGHG